MKRSEKTSAAVASTAGALLNDEDEEIILIVEEIESRARILKKMLLGKAKAVKSVAATALTQAPDRNDWLPRPPDSPPG